MGFGYGQTTTWNETAEDKDGKRVAKVHRDTMVAHIWNAQSQTFARTSNGNFAFVGTECYSYGRGWIVGKLFNGAALINGEKYSVTTSGHESCAWSATGDRIRFDMPELTSGFASRLDLIEGYLNSKDKHGAKDCARRTFNDSDFHDMLKAVAIQPQEYGKWEARQNPAGRMLLGEFIAEAVGLKPAAYHNAAAKLDRAAKVKADAKAKAERERFVRDAKSAADQPDASFRETSTIRDATSYNGKRDLLAKASDYRRYRLKAGLSDKRRAKLWEREKRLRAVAADFDRLHSIATRRSRLASLIRYARQTAANVTGADGTLIGAPRPLAVWSSGVWRTLSTNLAELAECMALPMATRVALAARADACKEQCLYATQRENAEAEREREERRLERERTDKERAERQAVARADWLAGRPAVYSQLGHDWSREDGTPFLRVYDGKLETSWGAEVPLAHAVKVFRFVKLCRERGQAWHRNGKTIRVGHFQVDSVSANGDFTAGCHRFTWAEVERVARAAGVFEQPADSSAVEESK